VAHSTREYLECVVKSQPMSNLYRTAAAAAAAAAAHKGRQGRQGRQGFITNLGIVCFVLQAFCAAVLAAADSWLAVNKHCLSGATL